METPVTFVVGVFCINTARKSPLPTILPKNIASAGRLTMIKEDERRSIQYKLMGNDALIYINPRGIT